MDVKLALTLQVNCFFWHPVELAWFVCFWMKSEQGTSSVRTLSRPGTGYGDFGASGATLVRTGHPEDDCLGSVDGMDFHCRGPASSGSSFPGSVESIG
jgi:hypothetical protein